MLVKRVHTTFLNIKLVLCVFLWLSSCLRFVSWHTCEYYYSTVAIWRQLLVQCDNHFLWKFEYFVKEEHFFDLLYCCHCIHIVLLLLHVVHCTCTTRIVECDIRCRLFIASWTIDYIAQYRYISDYLWLFRSIPSCPISNHWYCYRYQLLLYYYAFTVISYGFSRACVYGVTPGSLLIGLLHVRTCTCIYL